MNKPIDPRLALWNSMVYVWSLTQDKKNLSAYSALCELSFRWMAETGLNGPTLVALGG
jgi:hypothetical protein